MLVCVFLCAFAHETAGAARTRLSLRPLLPEGEKSRRPRAFHAARMRTHALAPFENERENVASNAWPAEEIAKHQNSPSSKGCLSKAGCRRFFIGFLDQGRPDHDSRHTCHSRRSASGVKTIP